MSFVTVPIIRLELDSLADIAVAVFIFVAVCCALYLVYYQWQMSRPRNYEDAEQNTKKDVVAPARPIGYTDRKAAPPVLGRPTPSQASALKKQEPRWDTSGVPSKLRILGDNHDGTNRYGRPGSRTNDN